MGKTICKAKMIGLVPHRGRPTVEWMKGKIPQYYCYGWKDLMTDIPFKVCRECPDFVDNAQEDLEKWRLENEKRKANN